MTNSYAVITGASSGIGQEFAKKLALKGYNLVLVARREERLKMLADKIQKKLDLDIRIVTEDLSTKVGCFCAFEAVKDLDVEIFINCAGFGDCNKFEDGPLDKELEMIDVNCKAVHILTKLMLQKMKEKDFGFILNVASSAGLLPAGPYMATYYATKAYVASLTRGIAEELRQEGSNVYVGALCPGPVDTEFNSVADVEFALKGISPRYCAEYALREMWKRKVTIVPTMQLKAAILGQRFLPIKATVRMTAGQQKKKKDNL